MGRELRRVPANWEHPRNDSGAYQPMFDTDYETKLEEWLSARANFKKGLDDLGNPLDESARKYTFEEWHGKAPDPDYYRPVWKDEERTQFQMYETTSEGTPVSPVLESPEAVAQWCAENGTSAFADMTAPIEYWRKVCEGSAGFGMMVNVDTGEAAPS